jgi:hypothetical protein
MNMGEAYGGPSRSKTSIVPLPNLYPRIDAVVGGGQAINRVYKPIQGTKATARGYSKAPEPMQPSDDELNDETISRVRELIRLIHLNNQMKESKRA